MEIFEVTYKFVFETQKGRQKSITQTYRDFDGNPFVAHKKASMAERVYKREPWYKKLKSKKVLNTAWMEYYE